MILGFQRRNTPTGSRLARMVMATSNGPCLRVSHGSVPVSAKLAAAPLPMSRAALATDHRAESRGRQEHHLSVGEMRRKQLSDIALREGGAGHRSSSALWTAFRQCQSSPTPVHVVSAIGVLEDNARACRAMRRYLGRVAPPHRLTSWPWSAKSPAAANEPLPPPSTAIFKTHLLARAPARRAVAA